MLNKKVPQQETYRRRLVFIIIISTIGFVLGLIVIMIALERIFFSSWYNNIVFNQTCPKSEAINFLNKMKILQIIFIVMLSISTGIFFIILCLSLYNILNRQKWYKYWNKLHIFYSICISIGILTALIVLLYVLKLFIHSHTIKDHYQNGKINKSCFNQSSFAFLQAKMSTLIILLVLTGIMLLLYIFNVAFLPSRFIIGQNPKILKKNQQLIKKMGISIPNAEILRDQILQGKTANKLKIDQQQLIPITSTNRRILQNSVGINTQGDIYLIKNYKNKQVQINQLQQNNKNKIQTKQIAIQTNNPNMKSIKVQVNLDIPILQKVQKINKDDIGIQIGVWTGDGLYKLKNSGVQAVNQTQYRSFGIGQNEIEQSQTQYKSCGVGDDDIWNNQYYNNSYQQQHRNPITHKIHSKNNNNTPRDIMYQQSQITRQNNNNKIPISRSRSNKPSTPISQNSTYRPMSSTTGYYYKDKQIQQPQLNAMFILPQKNIQNKPMFKKDNINSKSKIEQKSQQYHDATISYMMQSKSKSQLKIQRQIPTISMQKFENNQTPSRRSSRQEKMNKLRDRFKHKISVKSQVQQISPAVIYENPINTVNTKPNRNLKLDTTLLQNQKRQNQQNLTYKKQLMGEYMQKSNHTPHSNRLRDKGTIPDFIKKQLTKPQGNGNANRTCNVLEPGSWCSGTWCG